MWILDFSFVSISFLDSTFGVPVFLHFGVGFSVLDFSFCIFFNQLRTFAFSLGQSVGFEDNSSSSFAQEQTEAMPLNGREFYCSLYRLIISTNEIIVCLQKRKASL